MEIEEAIEEFKMENDLLGVRNPMKVARNELAISALREQQEREKGCEYCNPEVMSGNPIFSRHADGYLGNGKFCTDNGVGVKAYYCPHCGRRLEEGKEDGRN